MSAAGASTASQSPTGLDGCITAAEATLMQFAGGASGEISAAIFGTGQVGVVVSNTIVGRACDLLPWARELATQGYCVIDRGDSPARWAKLTQARTVEGRLAAIGICPK